MKNHLGLIEMLFIFVVGIAVVLWELYSLRKSRDQDAKTLPRDSNSEL